MPCLTLTCAAVATWSSLNIGEGVFISQPTEPALTANTSQLECWFYDCGATAETLASAGSPGMLRDMTALSQNSTVLDAALSFLFPPVCQLCNESRARAADGYICPDCYRRVRFVRDPLCERCGLPFEGSITGIFECSNCRDVELHFTSARSAVLAKDAVLEVIHRYKYNRSLWFEPFLADLLIRAAREEVRKEDWDVIVPVPLHPTKQREREFNQAERLARRLGRTLDIPVQTRWLRRTTATRTQTLLSRTERAANVRHAFTPARGLKLDGERIVLIDDVLTTGATTNACAKALRDAGASQVCVWTVARGI